MVRLVIVFAAILLLSLCLAVKQSQNVRPVSRGGMTQNQTEHSVSKDRARIKYLSGLVLRIDPNVLPTNTSMDAVIQKALDFFVASKGPYIILTLATISYGKVILNWREHINLLGWRSYIILCLDRAVYDLVGAEHGVYMSNSFNTLADPRLTKPGFHLSYHLMTLFKYQSVLLLLRAKVPVLWTDADCVLMRPCALDYLYRSSNVKGTDLLAQKGTSPYSFSERFGATVCTGFFLVNPTNASMELVRLVRDRFYIISHKSIHIIPRNVTSHRRVARFIRDIPLVDDQSIFNSYLIAMGGFGDLNSFEYRAWLCREGGRALFSNGENSSEEMEYSGYYRNRGYYSSEAIRLENSSLYTGKFRNMGAFDLTVGLLPYNLFPRGNAATTGGRRRMGRDDAMIRYRLSTSSYFKKKHDRGEAKEESYIRAVLMPTEGFRYSVYYNDSIRSPNVQTNGSMSFAIETIISSSTSSTRRTIDKRNNPNGKQPEPNVMAVVLHDSSTRALGSEENEWTRYKDVACVWHLQSSKFGEMKVEAMTRDHVYIE